LAQWRKVFYFFLDYSPFLVGVGNQTKVIVGDDETFVILLNEDLFELGRNADSAFGVYGVLIPTPEHRFIPLFSSFRTTFPHFLPLRD
jgi:hypothetical protein